MVFSWGVILDRLRIPLSRTGARCLALALTGLASIGFVSLEILFLRGHPVSFGFVAVSSFGESPRIPIPVLPFLVLLVLATAFVAFPMAAYYGLFRWIAPCSRD